MARLLVVSKDNGDTKMLLPIAKEAMRQGHKVIILAEGVGVSQYESAGITPFFSDVPNPDPKTNFNLNEFFRYLSPEVVLVGFPGPTNLSRKVAIAANERDVPVVGVEDYWGGVKRNPDVVCSLVLTIDDYAAKIAQNCVQKNIPVRVIGNHAIPGADYKIPEAVLDGMKKIRSHFAEVFVYGGGDWYYTTEELKLLVPSLMKTPGNWCLISRYHPNVKRKIAEELKDGRTFAEVWDEMLSPLGDRVVRLDAGNSDDMAMVCDAYFSSMGSSMNTAIFCGKPTIAVLTEATAKGLQVARLDAIPAVHLGGAQTLVEVQDVRPLLVKPSQAQRDKFKPLNAHHAIAQIKDMLCRK